MAKASHGSVLDHLGTSIAGGKLAAGTVLTLAELSEQYDVSRTVIREAIRVLEAKGMVESRRRVGVTIQPIEFWSNLDTQLISWRLESAAAAKQIVALTELRLAIEPVAAGLSAERANEGERQEILRLAGILERLGREGKGDTDEYLEADIAFHDLLLDASRNPLLASVKTPIAQVLTGRHVHGLTPAAPFEDALHNHIVTAKRIADGDVAGAEAGARGYVVAILSEVRETEKQYQANAVLPAR